MQTREEKLDSRFYRAIVHNMDGGVITINAEGTVTTFNAAAGRILNVNPTDVLGLPFAGTFMREGMDAFNEALLDAVYERAVGYHRAVEIDLGGVKRSVAVSTSYLQSVQEGVVENIGIVAVFGDITEIKELRDAELRLAEAAKVQHSQLQEAYREIEDKNRALAAVVKKVQAMWVVASIVVVGLFLALGVYAWNTGLLPAEEGNVLTSVSEAPGMDQTTITVVPQRIASSISLVGHLAPRREVSVISPLAGKIAATHFEYGQQVAKGKRLIDFDTSETERKHHDAEKEYISALRRFKELEDWPNGIEVARAKRAVSRSKLELEASGSKVKETAWLLERGVIPASEHTAVERQYRNQQMDYTALQRDLQAVLAKGGAEALRLARLDLDSAVARMQELEGLLKTATVDAPVRGVILYPARNGPDGQAVKLARGQSVTQGELLLTIGDLEGLSVVAKVDEVNIVKIRPGHSVRISGDAFPGLVLQGTVIHVASQASRGGKRNALPTFDIRVGVDALTPERWQQLRLGMSASLEVIVYENPDALLVPLNAVRMQDGQAVLRVQDPNGGGARQVPVETGVTTVDSVEIVRGLEAGDKVLLFQP